MTHRRALPLALLALLLAFAATGCRGPRGHESHDDASRSVRVGGYMQVQASN